MEPGKSACAACAARIREDRRQRRARWAAEGRCHSCGRELKDDGFVTCEICRNVRGKRRTDAAKEKREAWKAEGLCAQCGKRWAEPGRTMCEPCLKANSERMKRNDPDHAKKYAWRRKRIDAGICIDCGRKAEPGKARCKRCREMRRDSEIKYRIRKKIEREARKRGSIQDCV